MALEQIVDIPPSRNIQVRPEIPVGRCRVLFFPEQAAAEEAKAMPQGEKPSRIGWAKGRFKVPDDFDTMFQDEIIAMFEGKYDGSEWSRNNPEWYPGGKAE